MDFIEVAQFPVHGADMINKPVNQCIPSEFHQSAGCSIPCYPGMQLLQIVDISLVLFAMKRHMGIIDLFLESLLVGKMFSGIAVEK
jgi:hypothetical protein